MSEFPLVCDLVIARNRQDVYSVSFIRVDQVFSAEIDVFIMFVFLRQFKQIILIFLITPRIAKCKIINIFMVWESEFKAHFKVSSQISRTESAYVLLDLPPLGLIRNAFIHRFHAFSEKSPLMI